MDLNFETVTFRNFKAFGSYTVALKPYNILVGPNNAGKSTILSSFRILSEALRRAQHRNPELVESCTGKVKGYPVLLGDVPISRENVFHNYDKQDGASIEFFLTNKSKLKLEFPEQGVCSMTVDHPKYNIANKTLFNQHFPLAVGTVPVLGPVEDHEPLYQKEAAREALLSHRASRNFRNIWHHFGDDFEMFSGLIKETWPSMEVQRPEYDYESNALKMYCLENRRSREIFWMGFGFQVWCQLLTYIVQNKDSTIIVIDEPGIYLHSSLQRQLVSVLHRVGPRVVIATHSTEIITEAESGELVLIDKNRSHSKRVFDMKHCEGIFALLGSSHNPIMTQVARTRRVLFVEGGDFGLLARFSRKLGHERIANQADFAVVPAGGFRPAAVKDFLRGVETAIGHKLLAAVVFDRDYRRDQEVDKVRTEIQEFALFCLVHPVKEIENYLLVASALFRLVKRKVAERDRIQADKVSIEAVKGILDAACDEFKHKVLGQFVSECEKEQSGKHVHKATLTEQVSREVDARWKRLEDKLDVVPGKEVLSKVNARFQEEWQVSVTAASIVETLQEGEIRSGLIDIISKIDAFSKREVPE